MLQVNVSLLFLKKPAKLKNKTNKHQLNEVCVEFIFLCYLAFAVVVETNRKILLILGIIMSGCLMGVVFVFY